MDVDVTPETAVLAIAGIAPETDPSFSTSLPPTGQLVIEGHPLGSLPLEWTFLSRWLYNRAVVLVYGHKYDVIKTLLADGTTAFVALEGGIEVTRDPSFEGLMVKLHTASLGQFAW